MKKLKKEITALFQEVANNYNKDEYEKSLDKMCRTYGTEVVAGTFVQMMKDLPAETLNKILENVEV